MNENSAKKMFSTKKLAIMGLMAALVYVGNWLRIPVSLSAVSITAVHLGNVLCVLSGLLLGGVGGGLAAGVGGFVFDLSYPQYAPSAVFTLCFKFALAFVVGIIAYSGGKQAGSLKRNIIAAIAGSLTYMVLFIGKGFVTDMFFMTLPLETVLLNAGMKAWTSTVNAVLAVSLSIPLFHAIKNALKAVDLSLQD